MDIYNPTSFMNICNAFSNDDIHFQIVIIHFYMYIFANYLPIVIARPILII